MLFWMMASMMVPLAVVMQMVGLEDQLRGAGEATNLSREPVRKARPRWEGPGASCPAH